MRRTTMWTGAAALGLGVLALGPLRAAADSDDWFDDVLAGLVEDGTLTAEQATAVDDALTAARPGDGPWAGGHRAAGDGHGRGGGHGPGGHAGRGIHRDVHRGWGAPLGAAADAIGIDRADLLAELRDGRTIADVAAANGVDVDAVIDAMVAAAEAHLDDAVAAGRIDDAGAEARRAELRERITDHVNDGFGPGRHGRFVDDDDTDPTTPTTGPAPPTSDPAPPTTG